MTDDLVEELLAQLDLALPQHRAFLGPLALVPPERAPLSAISEFTNGLAALILVDQLRRWS